jgi:hypothetical protein
MLRAGEIERQESAGRFGHVDIATGGQQLSDEEIAEMLSFSEDKKQDNYDTYYISSIASLIFA